MPWFKYLFSAFIVYFAHFLAKKLAYTSNVKTQPRVNIFNL